jgi:hypothetical protein
MRSVLIAMLLAGVATPAFAQDGRFHERGDRHAQSSNDQSNSTPSDAKPAHPQRSAEPQHGNVNVGAPSDARSGMGRQHGVEGGASATAQANPRSAGGEVHHTRGHAAGVPTAE